LLKFWSKKGEKEVVKEPKFPWIDNETENPITCFFCENPSCALFRLKNGNKINACEVHGYNILSNAGWVLEVFDEVRTGEMYTALHIDSQILVWVN